MKKQSLSLSGEWQICWQDTGKDSINETNELWNRAVPCQGPGDVHIALTEAGVIEDPLLDVNNEKCKWMEEKEFWYNKMFFVKRNF